MPPLSKYKKRNVGKVDGGKDAGGEGGVRVNDQIVQKAGPASPT